MENQHMKSKPVTQTASVILFLGMLLLFLAGCSPSTPVPQLSVVQLPDGSKLVVSGATEVSLLGLTGTGAPVDQGWLLHGDVLVVSQQPAGMWFTILTPGGFVAHVTAAADTPGAIMLVRYDATTGKFSLDCILGICELGADAQHLSGVPKGQQGSLDQNGVFSGPTTTAASVGTTYAAYIQVGAPVATYTSSAASATATPNLAATGTLVCQQFNAQFPGTPCPPMLSPAQAATATKVCQQFNAQFPATPCP
jgi:hypothetical protein